LIPDYLIKAFPNKIINIHPALLPKYGGEGMYGQHVHKAVIENEEKESGITIHLVNEEYDKGEILFQAKCEVTENDSPDSLAEKIHTLEQTHFPKVIEEYILKQQTNL
jgi:phosphoribosylglycinamide formyltransferase-1